MSIFGYVNDQDESLKSKSGGKFGLNQGAFITKLEYNPNGGSDGSPLECIDITVKVGDRDFMNRIFDATDKPVYSGGEQVSPGEEGYQAALETEMKQRLAVVIHTVKSLGVTDAQLQQALATAPADFKGWAEIVTSLVGSNFSTIPVDVFLEYQYNIREGQDKTYLIVPNNMKGGYFLSPATTPVGAWNEVRDGNGLKYVDNANNEHTFNRDSTYMEGNKAKQQKEGEEDNSQAIQGNQPAQSAGTGSW